MNTMVNLVELLISSLVYDLRSEKLAKIWMDYVVLTFSMVVVIIVDTHSKFGFGFVAMRVALDSAV